MEETMVLIMLVIDTCVCPGELISVNNALSQDHKKYEMHYNISHL